MRTECARSQCSLSRLPDCRCGASAARAAAVLVTEFIADPSPTPQCHASTIVETPGGLVAAWFGGPYERRPRGVHLRIAAGRRALERAGRRGHRKAAGWRTCPDVEPGPVQAARRPVAALLQGRPRPGILVGHARNVRRRGRTWSGARRLPDGILGPIKNKPLQLANGDILCGSSTESPSWDIHFERTRDAGMTWDRVALPKDRAPIEAIQPALLRHGDGRLQAIGRAPGPDLHHRIEGQWSDVGAALTARRP